MPIPAGGGTGPNPPSNIPPPGAYASVAQVATMPGVGPLTDEQQVQVANLLVLASVMVRNAYPDIDTRINAAAIDPLIVALAVTNMVARVVRNPSGARSETVGPFSRTWDTTQMSGQLALTPAEDTLLIPPPTGIGVGTINVRPGLAPPPVGSLNGDHGWRLSAWYC